MIKVAGALVLVMTAVALIRVLLAGYVIERRIRRTANVLKNRPTINLDTSRTNF